MKMPCSRSNTRLITCFILALTGFYLAPAEAAKTPKNQLPIANAGLDQLAGLAQSVSLNASQSYDPDGTLQKYQWLQIKGAKVKIAGAKTATPTFVTSKALKKSKPVDLVFKLTITDNRKGRAIDKININVSNQPCIATQQLKNGNCVTPNPAVETTTVQPKLDGLNLANTRYTLMSDDGTQPFSPQTQTSTLNIDTSTPKLVMLVNEQNQPILMSRNHAGDKAVNIDIASTAEVLLLAQPYFFGVPISDTKALSARIRQQPLFADLIAALQAAINSGSPCPLMPSCNQKASNIADALLEALDVNDLVVPAPTSQASKISSTPLIGRKSSQLRQVQNKGGSGVNRVNGLSANDVQLETLNGRAKVTLDGDGNLTVSNSYLTYYLLRGRAANGELGGWEVVSPSDQIVDFGDLFKHVEWDGWMPKDINFKALTYNYEDTKIDLKGFALPSHDWKNTDLVMQGASFYDFVANIHNGKWTLERDGWETLAVFLMNTVRGIEIGVETIDAYGGTLNKRDQEELLNKIKPYAEFLSKPAELSEYAAEYLGLVELANDLLAQIANDYGFKAGDGSVTGYLLENSVHLKNVVQQVNQISGVFVDVKKIKNELAGELNKNIKKKKNIVTVGSVSGVAYKALLKETSNFLDKQAKYKQANIADEYLGLIDEILYTFDDLLSKKIDKAKSEKEINKLKKRRFILRAGEGLFTFTRLVFSPSAGDLDKIKNDPKVIIPAIASLGGAVYEEISNSDNVKKQAGKLISKNIKKAGGQIFSGIKYGKVIGNKIIPFFWDAVTAENYLSTSIVTGQLSQFGPLQSKAYIYHKAGDSINTYTSNTQDSSQNLTIKVKAGDQIYVSTELSRPLLFSEERSPWLTNFNFPPSTLYDTSINVTGRSFNRTILCSKKQFGNLTYSVHELAAPTSDYLLIASECGADTKVGGDWYQDRNTAFNDSGALIRSAVYNSTAALPSYYQLAGFSDNASRSIAVRDFFVVQNTDSNIVITNTGYNANGTTHIITLEQIQANCTLPWGASLQHGVTTLTYQAASVAIGNSCVSELRSCSSGVLSGSYQYPACTVQVDSDGDGMPDDWETDHGLNPAVNDAALDKDGDYVGNLKEYQDNTDPADKNSFLPGSVTCTAPLVLQNGTCVNPPTSITSKLNDTGITTCSDATSNNLVCPVTDFPGQDAQQGRDVTHNDDSDGHAGFSYTKLDSNGNPLPANASQWDCVKDNVTGLIWEVKTIGGLHNMDNTYSWYEPDDSKNGGSPGTQNSGICIGSSCDTYSYVQAVNAQGLCNATDWRMPTKIELLSIMNNATTGPAIDTNFFPNPPIYTSWELWSSSPYASNSAYAWFGESHSGGWYYGDKAYSAPVRLVRGGQ